MHYSQKLFFKYNLFLTIFFYALFLIFNTDYTFLTLGLTLFGTISTAATLYLIYYLVLMPFSLSRKLFYYIGGSLFFITNLALVVDFFIFRLYKYHINAMVLNILFSPDAFNSIEIGIIPVLVFIFFVLSLFGFEIWLYKKVFMLEKATIQKSNFAKIILFIIVVEKLSYGFASFQAQKDILVKFRVIPLYQPLTFNSFIYKHFGYKPKIAVQNTIIASATLNYPKEKLEFNRTKHFNVFIIASDAVQYAALNKEDAPNLVQFKKENINFSHHYSGGNGTRFGIFSLMQGINATYWFSFLEADKGSVLFDSLNQLDYETHIVFSTSTMWPEFRKTCFSNVKSSIDDDYKGKPWQKDQQSSQRLLDIIDNYDGKRPIFSFLFMDAPHGYSFPPQFNKFQAKENIDYVTIAPGSPNLKEAYKAYKNAIFYNDFLFKKIIDKLKEKKLYDNSLIIYTTDHGQEFYEYGFFGHTTAFDDAQIHIPFFVKLPKFMEKKLKPREGMTSHLDFIPTLLRMLGVKNKAQDYSSGYSLFNPKKRDFIFTTSWNYNAIVTPKYSYIFANRPDKLFQTEIRDTKTYKLLKDVKVDNKLVLKVMQQNREFIK